MRSRRLGRIAALAGAAPLLAHLGGCSLTRPEEEPAYVKATAVEERVDRIENQNKALADLQHQVEQLQSEMRRLRGEFEDFQHEGNAGRDRQGDLYRDLDKRLSALESAAPAAAGGGAAAPPALSDRDLYQSALGKLKSRDYAGAEQALTSFINSYPQSSLIDNAEYWLGETYYVEQRFPDALAAFQRVVREHPDSRKVPDALLKAGYTQYEQKRYREARELLAQVVARYPDSPPATEARDRLKRMDAEHH
jgi:tol-pal system protein YbgF